MADPQNPDNATDGNVDQSNPDYAAKAVVAYAEAQRLIDSQATRLDETRTRAATLLSAASISAAFLGAQALNNNRGFQDATWVATIAFAVVGLCAVALLVPWCGWQFTNNPKKLIADYVEQADLSVADMHRWLAEYTDNHYLHNEKRMGLRYLLLAVSCGALVVEVIFFLIDLTNRST